MRGIAVGNLWPGCWDVLFHFLSFRLLQAGITSDSPGTPFSQLPLHPSSYTALGQLSQCRFWAALGSVAGGGWELSLPLRCQSPVRYLQSAPAHIAHSGLPVSKTMPLSVPVITYF